MKDENKNIDAFFSARLQNETVGEDNWNMPSDDIWNAAKPKFIDRKRPRRRFVFWLLIPVLALCLCVPLKLLEGEEMPINEIQMNNLVENSNPKNSNIEHSNIENSDVASLKMNSSITKQKNSNKSISDNQSVNEDLIPTQNEKQVKREINNAQETNRTINKSKTQEQSNPSNELIKQAEVQDFASEESTAIVMKKEEVKAPKVSRQKIMIPVLNAINTGNDMDIKLSSISENKLPEYPKGIHVMDPKFIIPIGKTIYRNEIGISHSELLLNLFLALDGEPDNDIDEYTLDSKYFNANVTGRKWLNRRWSFMTGMQYSSLNLDLNFSVIDTLDKDIMQFINEEVNDIQSRSSIRDQETDIDIVLKDGIDIQLGDLLNLRGDVQLKIRAFQIPFFLDYHIYRKKMEYIFGLGVTLEHLSVSQTTTNFEIYKTNQLINKPANIPDYNENFIDGSIYLKSGIRYSISERFNFGLDAKINLLGLPFSGVDAGFYYRWN